MRVKDQKAKSEVQAEKEPDQEGHRAFKDWLYGRFDDHEGSRYGPDNSIQQRRQQSGNVWIQRGWSGAQDSQCLGPEAASIQR